MSVTPSRIKFLAEGSLDGIHNLLLSGKGIKLSCAAFGIREHIPIVRHLLREKFGDDIDILIDQNSKATFERSKQLLAEYLSAAKGQTIAIETKFCKEENVWIKLDFFADEMQAARFCKGFNAYFTNDEMAISYGNEYEERGALFGWKTLHVISELSMKLHGATYIENCARIHARMP